MDYQEQISNAKKELNEKILSAIREFENTFGLLFDGIESERTAVEGAPQTVATTKVDAVFITK